MAPVTDQAKAECVLWMHECQSPTQVIRKYRNKYSKNSRKKIPSRSTIRLWYRNFLETGHVMSQTKKGRKAVDPNIVERLQRIFREQPRTSIRVASQQVPVSVGTVHRIVRKQLKFYPYKIQMVHALKQADYQKRQQFALTLLARIEEDPEYLNTVFFSDEATFHISGRVHRHNVRIWGEENPHVSQEHERDSPKVNVWAGMFRDQIIGPFFFEEETIRQENFLDMLINFACPQLRPRRRNMIFQLDGAPAHWGLRVRNFLNTNFPERWIGRDGPTPWPPRSPDLTPLDFFLWGFVKTRLFRTPVHDIPGLRDRITEVFTEVTQDMLINTWREMESRLQMLRLNGGSHVEVY